MSTAELTTAELATADLAAWLAQQTWSDFAQSLAAYYDRKGALSTEQERSARSMYAKVAARNASKAAPIIVNAASEPGFYLMDEVVYKVQMSKTGNLYAKRRISGGWEYAGGVRYVGLTPDHAVTPEVAAQYGAETGVCIFCNAELDDREGLGRIVGVGPVCSKKHLGLTQRQLAERLGVDPDAKPVARWEVLEQEWSETAMWEQELGGLL